MLLGSGSIRGEKLWPIVTLQDLMEIFPYDDSIHLVKVTWNQLKRMLLYMLRDESFEGEHTEFYQFSEGLHVTYNRTNHEIEKFTFEDQPIKDDQIFKLWLQKFHFINLKEAFNITLEEIEQNGTHRIVSTSCRDVIEEYLSNNQHINVSVEENQRLIVKK